MSARLAKRLSLRTADTPKGDRKQRYDIQGLRALAVLLVIADHFLAWPTGGFVGVDVFFVISGFVITASLIREHLRTGKISFADFYRRRARRILPLATLVILLTLLASWAVFSTSRFTGIAEDGLWSFLSVANWHLALAGTDYMQADGVVSPLQHFWSLAVEEQFYFVWPWLIVLMLGALASRRQWSAATSRGALAAAMTMLIVLSFAFSLWETASSPTFAYFSTFSRAWELGVGGMLAVLAPAMKKLPDGLRPLLAYVGLAGILAGAFLITPQMSFPGPWAMVPVLATAAVIAAGTGGEQRHLQPLTNTVSRYVGDVSYSLYLWHFPVIILLEALMPTAGILLYVVALALTFALSAWSYSFIEEPVRKSHWLEPKSRKKTHHDGLRKLTFGGLIALGLATAIVVSLALSRDVQRPVAFTPPTPLSTSEASQSATSPEVAKLQRNLQAALATNQWPELVPSIDTLGVEAKVSEWVQDGCLGDERGSRGTPEENASRCTYGDPNASKTAVVLGDSIAISYIPAVRAALEPQGYKIHVYTMQQCPSMDIAVLKGDKSPHPKCDAFREWTTQRLSIIRPQLVITSNAPGTLDRLASGATNVAAMAEWTEASKRTLVSLAGVAEQVVVLDPPPGGKALTDCATRLSTPGDCATTLPQRFIDMSAASRAAADASVGNLAFIDSKGWFCSPSDACPAFAGTAPTYADGAHITGAYSLSLGPVLGEALAETLN